jgi:hypothetical protein
MAFASRAVAATLIVAAVLPGIAHGQTNPNKQAGPGRISGRIVDALGAPIQDQTVNFRNLTTISQTMIEDRKVKTNRDGVFEISAADHTLYEISLVVSNLVFRGVGSAEVGNGGDLDIGNVVFRSSPGHEATVHVEGPVQIRRESPGRLAGGIAAYTLCAESAEFCAHPALHIIQQDGGKVDPPAEKEQVGVSSVRISSDNQAVGWLVDSDFCCASYPLQLLLVVYRPGKPLRKFRGDGRAIFGWHFVAGGRQVAFYQSFPHGDLMTHYELRDVETERLLDKWDQDSTGKMPAWVREFGQ